MLGRFSLTKGKRLWRVAREAASGEKLAAWLVFRFLFDLLAYSTSNNS